MNKITTKPKRRTEKYWKESWMVYIQQWFENYYNNELLNLYYWDVKKIVNSNFPAYGK